LYYKLKKITSKGKSEDEKEMGYKIRLSLMMFLQYAIWGVWAPVLSEYLIHRVGFAGTQVGIIYSLLPL